jgi:hypothetical protein
MKRLVPALMLALVACEPPPPELDGAPPPSASPAPPSALPADPLLPPGDLAGAPPPGALLPGVINLVPPDDMQVVENCETIIASDYTTPPKMVCLVFTDADTNLPDFNPALLDAMKVAGWALVRSQGPVHYFERPTPGSDCADVAVVSSVTDRKNKLVAHLASKSGQADALPTHTAWYAYSIPASTHQACGADRMKP